MSKNKFKIGDTVLRIGNDWGEVVMGQQYVVIDAGPMGLVIKLAQLDGTPLKCEDYNVDYFSLVAPAKQPGEVRTITKDDIKTMMLLAIKESWKSNAKLPNMSQVVDHVFNDYINKLSTK